VLSLLLKNWKNKRKSNTKRFVLKWGKGSVTGIQIIYKTMIIEKENIDDINQVDILPDTIKKVYFVRKIFASETKRDYDYGS
jgi:hypothetical protein